MSVRAFTEEYREAYDLESARQPTAVLWRGDVREIDRGIQPGGTFNLVDDSNPNPNWHESIGQFRALAMVAAPSGYMAVVAIQATAVPTQIPTIRTSRVIKQKFDYRGLMSQIAPPGEGLSA